MALIVIDLDYKLPFLHRQEEMGNRTLMLAVKALFCNRECTQQAGKPTQENRTFHFDKKTQRPGA
jgi:hypothetical protein